MACDKNTCRTCNQIARYRSFKKLLPASVQASFEEWFNEVYGDLEQAQLDLATSQPEWKAQFEDEKPIGINL